MDIRAKKSGVFVEALAALQAEVTVGKPFYTIDTSAVAAAKTETAAPAATPVAAAPAAPAAAAAPVKAAEEITVPVPVMGESITTGVLSQWSVKVGDFVKIDQIVGTVETDKVNVEVKSPANGVITKFFAKEGEEINVGNPLFVLSAQEGVPAAAAAPVKAAEAPKKADAPAAAKAAAPAAKEAPKKTAEKAVSFTGERTETRVKMTRMRQRIASRLKEAQNTAAMLTTFQEVDMTNLIEIRNKYKEDFEKVHGVKLGFMSAFVRVSLSFLYV